METRWLIGNGAPSLEAQILFRRALEKAGQGRFDEAVCGLRQAIMIAPRFIRAYEELGHCLEGIGRYPEALNTYVKILELDPLHRQAGQKQQAIMHMIHKSHGPGEAASTGQAGTTSEEKERSTGTSLFALCARIAEEQEGKSILWDNSAPARDSFGMVGSR